MNYEAPARKMGTKGKSPISHLPGSPPFSSGSIIEFWFTADGVFTTLVIHYILTRASPSFYVLCQSTFMLFASTTEYQNIYWEFQFELKLSFSWIHGFVLLVSIKYRVKNCSWSNICAKWCHPDLTTSIIHHYRSLRLSRDSDWGPWKTISVY